MTGAAGFIGANLARRLVADGHDVHLLVRPSSDRWRLEALLDDTRVHEAELQDADAVAHVLRGVRPEWVFHLAAHDAYAPVTQAREAFATDVGGLANLLEGALGDGFDAFVNSGTSLEYGPKSSPPSETEWLDPRSVHAVARAAATLHCRQVALSEDAHVVTLRLYSVYGPWEQPRRLVPRLAVAGLGGR